MYKIEIPKTIHQLMGIFYRSGMWSDTTTFSGHCRKLFYFIYFLSFDLSMAAGALTIEDNDERIFLAVASVIVAVLVYRMWILLWQKNGLLLLVNEIGKHSTNDRDEFIRINEKLNIFMKFVGFFTLTTAFAAFCGVVVLPITNEKRLIFNIPFPFDPTNSKIEFWIATVFIGGGFLGTTVSDIITKMVWFLMVSISFEYKILGNKFRNMGTSTGSSHLRVSLAAEQQLFYQDFIEAIQTYDKINE